MLPYFKLTTRLCLGLVFISFSVFAQGESTSFQSGKLYLKLQAESPIVIASVNAVTKDPRLAELIQPFQDYGVSSVKRPFLGLHTAIFDRVYELEFSRVGESQGFISALEEITWIEYAEKVPLHRFELQPNDPNWSSVANHLKLIEADLAWDFHVGGGAKVAIVDDAVQATHPDLAPNLWTNPLEIAGNGLDDDGNGYIDDVHGFDVADGDGDIQPPSNANGSFFSHGTHCAGIAAARTDNGLGIASVGYQTQLIGVKGTGDTDNPQFISNAYAGVVYATVAGADVISMSWSGNESSQTGYAIIREAHDRGIMLVAAAGNYGNDRVRYPAAYEEVLAVANTTVQDKKSSSSSFGDWVAISAPGTAIYSTVAYNGYENKTGTSMSTPMVAGLLGLMKSYRPGLPKSYYEYFLLKTADYIDWLNPGFNGKLGSGRINARRAMEVLSNFCYPNADSIGKGFIDSLRISTELMGLAGPDQAIGFNRQQVAILGDSLPIEVQFDALVPLGSSQQAAVYVDWNVDGDFQDQNEAVWNSALFANDTTFELSISIPSSAVRELESRIRVIVWEANGSSDPCQNFENGEVVDALYNLIPPICETGSVLVSEFPYVVDFEDWTLCDTTFLQTCPLPEGWSNASSDDLEWLVHQGSTPTFGTGPDQDIYPADLIGKYLYVETPDSISGLIARLDLPCLDLSSLVFPTITFSYHMFGQDMGSLNLEGKVDGQWETLWTNTGNRQNLWREAEVDLAGFGGNIARLRFVSRSGQGELGDVALGFVNIGDAISCEGEVINRNQADQVEDGSGRVRSHMRNADCTWLIQPYNARRIKVGFDRFQTIQDQDYLKLYDGENLYFPLLKELSGFGADSQFIDGGSLYLHFTSDDLGEQDGWQLQYEAENWDRVLSYEFGEVESIEGDTLLVPVNVSDFEDLLELEGKLQIEGGQAELIGLVELDPSLWSGFSFAVYGDSIIFNWSGNPTSLGDGTSLFMAEIVNRGTSQDTFRLSLENGRPGAYEAKRKAGVNNVSLILPTGDEKKFATNRSTSLQSVTSQQVLGGPNPFSTQFSLQINASTSAVVGVSLINKLGQTVFQGQYPIQNIGVTKLNIDTSVLSPGWYAVKVNMGGYYEVMKVRKN